MIKTVLVSATVSIVVSFTTVFIVVPFAVERGVKAVTHVAIDKTVDGAKSAYQYIAPTVQDALAEKCAAEPTPLRCKFLKKD